jgi:hypothetical protein
MQCYASKNVPRGKEFCNSNFDPETELEYWLICYEGIPVYTFEYCQLKHRGGKVDDKIKCFRNKAQLTLDAQFCNSKHPIEPGSDGE